MSRKNAQGSENLLAGILPKCPGCSRGLFDIVGKCPFCNIKISPELFNQPMTNIPVPKDAVKQPGLDLPVCKKCGKEMFEAVSNCPFCGGAVLASKPPAESAVKLQKCQKCETEVPRYLVTCPRCKSPMNVNEDASAREKKEQAIESVLKETRAEDQADNLSISDRALLLVALPAMLPGYVIFFVGIILGSFKAKGITGFLHAPKWFWIGEIILLLIVCGLLARQTAESIIFLFAILVSCCCGIFVLFRVR